MSSEKPQIQKTESPVTEGLLFVCEKCGKSDSRNLVDELKSVIKARGWKGRYRAVLSGCMDVCPKRGIAIAAVGVRDVPEFFVSEGSAEEVLARVTDKRRS